MLSKSIYVGNLQWDTTEKNLEDLFSQYGEVKSVQIIKDRDSGRSKGFGFIDMPNDEEATNAMDNLNNTELGSRNLKINEARKRTFSKRSYA